MIALLYIVLGVAIDRALIKRQPKEDPTMGGRIIRVQRISARPAEYDCPEALAWHAEQARLDAIK